MPSSNVLPTVDVAALNAILDDKFAAWVLATGVRVHAVDEASAILRIPFADQLCRVGGIICGQALLTGADTSMVLALSVASGGFKPCTTVDLTINYMRPITRADAMLTAKVMRAGKSLAFCTCEISDSETKKPAAFATGTFMMLG
jgi:uncharacterized protein (TIGR00369 family)